MSTEEKLRREEKRDDEKIEEIKGKGEEKERSKQEGPEKEKRKNQTAVPELDTPWCCFRGRVSCTIIHRLNEALLVLPRITQCN